MRPSRLALRIWLVGLAQVAIVALGFWAILSAYRPTAPGPIWRRASAFTRKVEPLLVDRAALLHELDGIDERESATVMLLDPEGEVFAASAGNDTPRCSQPIRRRFPPPYGSGPPPWMDGPPGPDGLPSTLPPPPPADTDTRNEGPPCMVFPIRFPEGGMGELHFVALAPPAPSTLGARIVPLVIFVVGISSLLLARSLTRPLKRMSDAAKAFGAGDLHARVGLTQRNELGDVGRAFDEMAERVTGLLRAEKELLANISHELRTPLARIRVALDIATEGDADVARESLRDIAGDLDELERLIADVLTAARLDLGDDMVSSTGLPPLRRKRVDTPALIAASASRFMNAHPERPLNVEVPESIAAVDGDPVLLRRVIDNLLENAHKYTEDITSPIDLIASASATGIEIEVRDRGIGIAETDLARVFRPFFRADKSRTRATGGLGLGLALAKRIIEAHGGTIELESALGEGTRARVRLPVTVAG